MVSSGIRSDNRSPANFGAVAAFNTDTLTTAMYRTWYGLFSISKALQIAAVLLLFVLALLALEQRARAGKASSR